ncbi:MAG: c-type cytochrome [Bacteroidales bacterium]|nr:c-type cytochrome [Bacteroidales bacterium]
MKQILVIITLTILNSNTLPSENTTIPPDAKNLKNIYEGNKSVIGYGAKIYKKQCWLCHGTNGKGNGPGAEEINTKPADFNSEQVLNRTDGELFWWISKGGNDMQPFENTLTEEDIWKVVNYIRKTQNKI